MIPLLVLAWAASAIWILAARRLPAARPVAAALAISAAAGAARAAGLPARIDMALYLSQAVISAELARVVLGRNATSCVFDVPRFFLLVCCGPVLVAVAGPATWWVSGPSIAWGSCVATEMVSAYIWWWRSPPLIVALEEVVPRGYRDVSAVRVRGVLRAGALPELAVLVLSACDAAALAEIAAGGEAWVLSRVAAWVSWGAALAIGALCLRDSLHHTLTD